MWVGVYYLNRIFVTICTSFLISSCSYFKYSVIQKNYANIQDADPSQVNLKHMIEQDRFFLWGKLTSAAVSYSHTSMVVVAYSDRFKQGEQVDVMYFKGTDTHYGLSLPEGQYTLLLYADLNEDQVFAKEEVKGKRVIALNRINFPEKVAKDINIDISENVKVSWAKTILAPTSVETKQSIHYPAGTIRNLDDPMFDANIATMGMYDPASFLQHAKTMFYALEEGVAHKIPVIFVHGAGGSSRSFKKFVEYMDKDRYQAWFFYYPSGGDLNQLASFFYNIFLSGGVIPMGEMPLVIVAHSMGGLIVREALNKYQGVDRENRVGLFISIASPFGGHPAAAAGEKHGVFVLPAWRDLNPASNFVSALYRKPLSPLVHHHLVYAYSNSSTLKFGENSDGVVPLSSQLHYDAQLQSVSQFGFDRGHADILQDEVVIEHLLQKMGRIKNVFPESHTRLLALGGINIDLPDHYSLSVKHLIKYAGKYLIYMIDGRINPINSQQINFVKAAKGELKTDNKIEIEFIRFMEEYPDLVNRILDEKSNTIL